MKIKVWMKYEEAYLPPRCRKLRYRECEEHADLTLWEVTMEDLRLAFEDNSYNSAGKIYSYKEKFWQLASVRDICSGDESEKHTPLENLIYVMDHSSAHFYDNERRRKMWGIDLGREPALEMARADIRKYLLVDGELYIQTAEPRYCIYTFGLGHNHGGTSLSVDYSYKSNISRDRYFSALHGKEAVAEAIRIATRRGDTESLERIQERLIVFAPDLVKINPMHQHGTGDPFLNKLDSITEVAPDALTAGLLCMASSVVDL